MRSLHLLLPGLLWPDAGDTRAGEGLRLPSLETCLRYGDRTRPAGGFEGWIAQTWGFGPLGAPLAALADCGAKAPPQPGFWMCADPVHLSPRGSELFLTAGDALELQPAEAEAFVSALNDFFREDALEFAPLRPDRWIVRASPSDAALETTALTLAHGRGIDPLMPTGAGARPWLSRLSEAQMLLHAHPANAEREAAGRIPVNSVWWSAPGSYEVPPRRPFATLFSNDPLLCGVAAASGATVLPWDGQLQAALAAATREPTLLHADTAARPGASADVQGWHAALRELDATIVRDALVSLNAGILDALVITGFGGRRGLSATLRRHHRLRVWRRPVAIGEA